MERGAQLPRAIWAGVWPRAVLVLLLLTINGLAIWGIVLSRSTTLRAAANELRVETIADAAAIESQATTLASDVRFLSQASALAGLFGRLASESPLERRWSRLDAEGALLLFAEGHASVEALQVFDAAGQPKITVARRDGVPVVLPSSFQQSPGELGGRRIHSHWVVGEGPAAGSLQVTVDVHRLLRAALAGRAETVSWLPVGEIVLDPPAVAAVAPVRLDGWQPSVVRSIVRREEESRSLQAFEQLAFRYRISVLLNSGVVVLTLLLGAAAVRSARRAALLEAEHQRDLRLLELERQLQQSERLVSVGRLAAGLAHEINNPLEGVSNYLQLLDEDLRLGRVDTAASSLAGIRRGFERIAGIVRRVLQASRPGGTVKCAVDLGPVLDETMQLVASGDPQVRADLTFGDDPLVVWGDPVGLGQLFLNLLLNARQAQPVEAWLGVHGSVRDGMVEVEVRDRGPGFDEPSLARLFEPFSSTRGSTGLGLAVCKGIVDDHGGVIAASNADPGAKVTVRLPCWRGEVPS